MLSADLLEAHIGEPELAGQSCHWRLPNQVIKLFAAEPDLIGFEHSMSKQEMWFRIGKLMVESSFFASEKFCQPGNASTLPT